MVSFANHTISTKCLNFGVQVTFTFSGFSEMPAVSLNRRFAPVKVKYAYLDREMAFLAQRDPSAFSRWDVMQTLAKEVLLKVVGDVKARKELVLDKRLLEVFHTVLADKDMAFDLKAAMLTLPSEEEIANDCVEVDPSAIHTAREFVVNALARKHQNYFWNLYAGTHFADYGLFSVDSKQAACRAVANMALRYLCSIEYEIPFVAYKQFRDATNMTDRQAAFVELVFHKDNPLIKEDAERAIAAFYEEYKDHENVVDKWFAIQAMNPSDGTLETVKALMGHPAFCADLKNPNRVRSLVGAFVMQNPVQFHALSGEGYTFFTDFLIAYDRINPEVASRMVDAIVDWKRYDKPRQKLMLAQILRLDAEEKLSRGTRDKVSRSLRALYESHFFAE